jgi:hypothetical protein
MKRLGFLGMAVFGLALGLLVIGCDTGNGGSDSWTDLDSLDQLDGTWKGGYSQRFNTMKEAIESQGGTWDNSMTAMFGDMSLTISVEITMTINAAVQEQTGTMKSTQTFSGGNINAVWAMIKSGSADQPGVIINDTNHSITTTQDMGTNTIERSDMEGVQINQTGTKVKIPANTMGQGSPEIEFTKQ